MPEEFYGFYGEKEELFPPIICTSNLFLFLFTCTAV
jgi:hypothetical protein